MNTLSKPKLKAGLVPAFLFGWAKFCRLAVMQNLSTDVIVVGAGAAGLMAALELALTGKVVMVIEAKDGSGGRIKTVSTPDGRVVELGAEFVHGDLPLTKMLMKKAGCQLRPAGGTTFQHRDGRLMKQDETINDVGAVERELKELKTDVPIAAFLDTHFSSPEGAQVRQSVRQYAEGYYAADTQRASTFALREEWDSGDEEQYRPVGGYSKLVEYLEAECRKHNVQFRFLEPVTGVVWEKNAVTVKTAKTEHAARKVLLTLPVGVLQTNAVSFSPALPEKTAAAQALGFGTVAKVILNFKTAFWKDTATTKGHKLDNLGFLFSEEAFPTWWTQHPEDEPFLVGWLGGPGAKVVASLEEKEIVQKAVQSLSVIFSISVSELEEQLISAHYHNWQNDLFTRGGYSYNAVNGQARMQTILQPSENTVYFAGEGLHAGPQIGTVEAALASGRSVAHQLIAAF